MFMIRHIVSNIYADSRPRILYCAPTHSAVDEATARLLIIRGNMNEDAKFKGILSFIRIPKMTETNSNFSFCQIVVRIGGNDRQPHSVKDMTVEMLAKRFRNEILRERRKIFPHALTSASHANKISDYQGKANELKKEKAGIEALLDSGHEANDDRTPLTLERIGQLQEDLTGVKDRLEGYASFIDDAIKEYEAELALEEEFGRRYIIDRADVICTTLDACNSPEMLSIFVEYN